MAAASFVNPPSVHGISHDADEADNGQTLTAAELPKEAPPPTANVTKIPSDLKEMPNKENLEIIQEDDGWVFAELPDDVLVTQSSMETTRAAARASEIALNRLNSPRYTVAKKAVMLGNASVTKMEAFPGDGMGVGFVVCLPAGVFKERDLKPVFVIGHRKLVIELNTTDEEGELLLQKLGMEKIVKEVGEFPEDVKVKVSGISWTWVEDDDGVLTVLVPLDHNEPEKETRPIIKFVGFVKAALAKACLAVKEFVDGVNDDTAI